MKCQRCGEPAAYIKAELCTRHYMQSYRKQTRPRKTEDFDYNAYWLWVKKELRLEGAK
jgi:hypothetical protein